MAFETYLRRAEIFPVDMAGGAIRLDVRTSQWERALLVVKGAVP